MKENVDVMAGLVSAMAALLRGLKNKLSTKDTIINVIIAGVLSFGVMFLITEYLPEYITNTRFIIFLSFFIGWISKDFTEKLENAIGDFYDILIAWFKSKFNSKQDEK